MKKYIIALLPLTLSLTMGCASRPHRVGQDAASSNSKSQNSNLHLTSADLAKIDKTIAAVNSQINELQDLNDKMFEKSLTADPKIEKEFEKKKDEYGSFESLQANLRILYELKATEAQR